MRRVLPAPLAELNVPARFPVSLLGGWGGCIAKIALNAQSPEVKARFLPRGVAQIRGTLGHRVLERWVKAEDEKSPGELFEEEYQSLVDRLKADPAREQYADIAAVYGKAEWNIFRHWVLQCCDRAGQLRARGSRRAASGGHSVETIRVGAEVPISSDELRLRGKADLIRYIGDGRYEVRDYKTGAVLNDDGEVKEEIALQLQAYGLMLLERRPNATIQLVVDNGSELAVAFDSEARATARARIEKAVSVLPTEGTMRAADLERPGPDCWGCDARNMCQSYIDAAPKWWRGYPKELSRIPADTWGKVISIGADGQEVRLVDDAERRICVSRLDTRHGLDQCLVGEVIYFFDLEGSGTARDFRGNRFHPRTFHELPRDQGERRAWALQCYEGRALI
jgi:RecB family exonuclease